LSEKNFHLLPKIVIGGRARAALTWKSFAISGELLGPTNVEKATALNAEKNQILFSGNFARREVE
jgi:hypothetical protein